LQLISEALFNVLCREKTTFGEFFHQVRIPEGLSCLPRQCAHLALAPEQNKTSVCAAVRSGYVEQHKGFLLGATKITTEGWLQAYNDHQGQESQEASTGTTTHAHTTSTTNATPRYQESKIRQRAAFCLFLAQAVLITGKELLDFLNKE
jgi:hypothetical protein